MAAKKPEAVRTAVAEYFATPDCEREENIGQMCRRLRIGPKTVSTWRKDEAFQREIDHLRLQYWTKKHDLVVQAMYQQAKEGSVTAALWWSRNVVQPAPAAVGEPPGLILEQAPPQELAERVLGYVEQAAESCGVMTPELAQALERVRSMFRFDPPTLRAFG